MAKAFVLPTGFMLGGTVTQMTVLYRAVIGDGSTNPVFYDGSFIFDAVLTPGQNLATLKQSVVTQAASNGLTLATTDVSVFTAIN